MSYLGLSDSFEYLCYVSTAERVNYKHDNIHSTNTLPIAEIFTFTVSSALSFGVIDLFSSLEMFPRLGQVFFSAKPKCINCLRGRAAVNAY